MATAKRIRVSPLTQTLHDLLRKALLVRDVIQPHRLEHGLHIWLYVTPARVLHFSIWRHKVRPSTAEWFTTLRHFPADVLVPSPIPEPKEFSRGPNLGLAAVWRLPRPGEAAPEAVPPREDGPEEQAA